MNRKLLASAIALAFALALPCTALAAQPSTPGTDTRASDTARAVISDTAIVPMGKRAKLVKKKGLYSFDEANNGTTAKVKGSILTLKGPVTYRKGEWGRITTLRKATRKFKVAKNMKFRCSGKQLTVVKHNAAVNKTLKGNYGTRVTVKGGKVVKMEFIG